MIIYIVNLQHYPFLIFRCKIHLQNKNNEVDLCNIFLLNRNFNYFSHFQTAFTSDAAAPRGYTRSGMRWKAKLNSFKLYIDDDQRVNVRVDRHIHLFWMLLAAVLLLATYVNSTPGNLKTRRQIDVSHPSVAVSSHQLKAARCCADFQPSR